MKIKLVIWDLDDTLWAGTLAEGDELALCEHRADFIRALNKHGIVSSICSKNDLAAAQKKLEFFGLWDEFVFPRIAFMPKGGAVKQLIEDMQLLSANVLFVDDNLLNLNEVKSLLPDINIVHSSKPECDTLLRQILEDNKDSAKSRVEEYRILQSKLDERQKQPSQSNEEFLYSCDIRIAFSTELENLEFKERIAELINRSNQLNYTKSRLGVDELASMFIDGGHYNTYAVFAWDKYGYYGLVGFAAYDRHTTALTHFVFSCRVMHMGIEMATLGKITQKFKYIDFSPLKKLCPLVYANWIKEEKFSEHAVRSMIREKENTASGKEPAVRIMYGCMAAGLAYFSRHRDIFDFDGAIFRNDTRFLSFDLMRKGAHLNQIFPPFLVYGAAFDYYDCNWSPDALPLEQESFTKGMYAFCRYFSALDRKVLVILPPTNMPEEYYRPSENAPRERIEFFNDAWRYCASFFPNITLWDLTGVAKPEDMPDASHFYAGFLKKMADYIDAWYESVALVNPQFDVAL